MVEPVATSPRLPVRRTLLVGVGLIVAALVGAFVSRQLSGPASRAEQRPSRPIVQIVRQQPGLPSLTDVIGRLCPSVAVIVPRGADPPGMQGSRAQGSGSPDAPAAVAISTDGWLLTSAALLPGGPLDAVFGDGRRVNLSDSRADPVSGLAIVKADQAAVQPLALADQGVAQVGTFGFGLTTLTGNGCAASSAMVASDFMADGDASMSYVRLQTAVDARPGVPFFDSDGRIVGLTASEPDGALIPAAIAALIADELIRGRSSATASFGFRAIDFGPPIAARLGDIRSGAGVALVEPGSAADRAGLQAGDVILAVNGTPVSSASELSRQIGTVSRSARLDVSRRAQRLAVAVRRP